MRNTAINTIFDKAKSDKNIVLLTADLGYSVMEEFQASLPSQFVNVGIAEQNMIGIAAGLALSGKKVFVYSITPFATMRCFEQIRLDVCYQNLDVTIIGVGGGFAYGTLGSTHHAIEDIAIMRCLPNMKIIAPADPQESKILTEQIIEKGGPAYLRLNRGGEGLIESEEQGATLGRARTIKEGNQLAIVACGAIVSVALDIGKKLQKEGISARVVSMHTVKPIDNAFIKKICADFPLIVSIEEHNLIGGLNSALSEIIAKNASKCKYISFGVNDEYSGLIGKQDYLRDELIGATSVLAKKIKETYEQG